MGLPLSLLTKLMFSVIIVVSAYNPKSVAAIAKETGYFFAVSFLFAGMMLFASSLPGISIVNYNNGVAYINLSFFSLIAACVICYAVTVILGKITKNKSADTVVMNIGITSDKKTINCSAIFDTGNSLTDPFTGEGVIIADRFTISEILPENIKTYLETGNSEKAIRLLPCKTVSGTALLPCFRPEKIRINDRGFSFEIEKPEIAVSSQTMTDVILPSSIYKNTERRKENATLKN